MEINSITSLKIKFQEIIDLISQKNILEARIKIKAVSDIINELIDYSKSDEELKALSPFQILLVHLQTKLDLLRTSLN